MIKKTIKGAASKVSSTASSLAKSTMFAATSVATAVATTVSSAVSSAKPTSSTVTPTTTPARPIVYGPTISVVNECSVLTDQEIQTAVNAIQVQIDRDFAPAWDLPATLVFVPKGKAPAPNTWIVHVMDNSDHAGALGYHYMTNLLQPEGKVFAAEDKKLGLSWSVTLSHEILEMLGDPYLNTTVFVQRTNTTGILYASEMCDAVEDDSLGYTIGTTLVSNFVLPAFYQPNRAPGSTKFDFCGSLKSPLTIGKHGYMSVFDVSPTSRGWSQQLGAEGVGPRLSLKLKNSSSRIAFRTNTINKTENFQETSENTQENPEPTV